MLSIIIILLTILLVLVYLLFRVYVLFFYNHYKKTKILKQSQFSKLNQRIILEDGYELNYQLKNYVKSKYFFICFHGLNESLKDFQWFSNFAKKHRFSYLSFDQRNFASNKRNSSFDLKRNFEDCIQIIKLIKITYPKKKIILLGHSLGSAICAYLATDKFIKANVFGIILTAIVFQKYIYNPFLFLQPNVKNVVNLLLGIFFFSEIVISLREYKQDAILGLTKKAHDNLFKNLNHKSIPLYFFAQAARYNKQIIMNLKHHQSSKIKFLIINHNKDHTTNLIGLNKELQKLKSANLVVKNALNAGHLINKSESTAKVINQLIFEWINEFDHKNSVS